MIEICDTHNDFLTELKDCEIDEYIDKVTSEGAKRICASFWTTKKENVLTELRRKSDILSNANKDFLLHIEDLGWVTDEKMLNELIEIHPFSCSLTWNDKNLLASGVCSKGGLTNWGKYCADRLIKCGIVIDVAHLNRQSFNEITKNLSHIYCSHSGFYGVKRHKRNLLDREIDEIVKSDGFIGLFFYDKAIRRNKKHAFSLYDIVEHIKYFTSRWGCDNIGIGSDFFGIENCPLGLNSYLDFDKLYKALKKDGFKDHQINKIFYLNFEKFLSRLKVDY